MTEARNLARDLILGLARITETRYDHEVYNHTFSNGAQMYERGIVNTEYRVRSFRTVVQPTAGDLVEVVQTFSREMMRVLVPDVQLSDAEIAERMMLWWGERAK